MKPPGPLPVVDEGSILQRESIDALKALLPRREFLFRDERVEDYGVDGSLELIVEGSATNIRAQVQLKGRSNTTANRDGVVAVQVATSNLNYLLNGICPLYVLYRPEANEVRFAFARDEWKRLERENPDWRDQGTITIRFQQALQPDTLRLLTERITEEARLSRSVADRVNRHRSTAAHIVVDSQNLKVVDSHELLLVLKQIGRSLTNSGLARIVIDRARLIPAAELDANPEAALAVAYAHFHLAHYYDASAALRRILLRTPNLDKTNTSLLDALFISTRRMLGELDDATYDREMESWLANAPLELAIQQQIAVAWSEYTRRVGSFESGPDLLQARARLTTLLEQGKRLSALAIGHYCELLELTLLERDAADALIDAQALRHCAALGQGDAHRARMVGNQSAQLAIQWMDRVRALAEATKSSAPQVHCQALLLRNQATLGQAMQSHFAAQCGHGPPLPASQIDAIFDGVEEALRCARLLENRELELSARQFLAKALDLFERKDEATAVASEALRIAELTGCSIHERQLREFLRGEDRAERRLEQLRAFDQASEEDIIRRMGDPELLFRAKIQLDADQLPEQRMPNVVRSLQAQRQLAIERRDWCAHIAHEEYRPNSLIMKYADPPTFRIVCTKLDHDQLAEPVPIARLTARFRDGFCKRCTHRTPDAPEPMGGGEEPQHSRAARNRAKAERRRRKRPRGS